MKTAVLTSGGLDSVYACYNRLVKSKDEITAIYFDFTDILGTRAHGAALNPNTIKVQIKCLTSIINWLSKNIRPINLEIVPITDCRYNGWWSTELILWSADKCNEGVYDEIISGWSGENVNYHRARILLRLQKKLFSHFAKKGKLSYPIEDITKIEIIKELPIELQYASVSCGAPTIENDRIYTCGACVKCTRSAYLEYLLTLDIPEYVKRGLYLQAVVSRPAIAKTYYEIHPDFELWNLLDE